MSSLAQEIFSARVGPAGVSATEHGNRLVKVQIARVLRLLSIWYSTAKQRRALLQLSDDQLKDIGISRADAIHEAGKPFWK